MARVKTSDGSSEKYPENKGYDVDISQEAEDLNHHLHRGLRSRQITMIAIGGAIGTGLIIGTLVIIPL
jgi:amino acid transporter